MVSGRASALRLVLLALAVTWASGARRVLADDALHSVRLIWLRAPRAESCIGEDELRERVATHLGSQLGDEHDALVIEGSIAPRASAGFTARLVVAGDEQGARTLAARGTDCRALDDALVLVVAAAIDALAPSREVVEEERVEPVRGAVVSTGGVARSGEQSVQRAGAEELPAPKAESVAREDVGAIDEDRDEDEDEDAHAHAHAHAHAQEVSGADEGDRAWRLSLGARLAAGLMPGAAGGGAVSLHWPFARAWRAELGVSFWPLGARPTDRGDADFQAARVDALICPAVPITRALSALACGGVSAGGLRAHGELDDGAHVSLRPLAGIVSWLFAELSLSRDAAWSVRAGAGVSIELWRDRFVVRDAVGREVLLHRVSQLVGFAGVELSAAL